MGGPVAACRRDGVGLSLRRWGLCHGRIVRKRPTFQVIDEHTDHLLLMFLQLTRERIRQLEAKILKKLRNPSRIQQLAPIKYH